MTHEEQLRFMAEHHALPDTQRDALRAGAEALRLMIALVVEFAATYPHDSSEELALQAFRQFLTARPAAPPPADLVALVREWRAAYLDMKNTVYLPTERQVARAGRAIDALLAFTIPEVPDER